MEDFVPFELAKKLKEKGFREKCLCHYIGNDLVYNIESPIANNQLWFSHNKFDNIWHRDNIDAPTISQVLKWLREIKGIDVIPNRGHIDINNEGKVTRYYNVCIYYYHEDLIHFKDNDGDEYINYELAALAGVEYCLDNLL